MMLVKKRPITLTILLLLYGCAAPKEGSWPTVSFGDDIAAIDAAIDNPQSYGLAPLPSLTAEEQAGSKNPESYFAIVQQEFFDLKGRLTDRYADYLTAKDDYKKGTDSSMHQKWLTAQMQLSNISQAVEGIRVIRAQLMLIVDEMPAVADFIVMAETLELENRKFLLGERLYLAQNQP